MSKFRCKCLNFIVYVKEKVICEVDGKVFVVEICMVVFFDWGFYEVELVIGGIMKVNIFLVVCNRNYFGVILKNFFDKIVKVWCVFCVL